MRSTGYTFFPGTPRSGKTKKEMQPDAKEERSYKRNRLISRILFCLSEIVLLLIICACSYLLRLLDLPDIVDYDPSKDVQQNSQEDPTYLPSIQKGFKTFVVFGIDPEDQTSNLLAGSNSDVIMLVSMNNDTGEIRLCSVYRDTLLKMTTGKLDKANSAMTHRDVFDSISTLNTNLDLQIEDYVVVNWLSVIKAINNLGGVELTITEDLLHQKSTGKPLLNGYITQLVETTGVGSTQIHEPGTYLCDGVQAVAYCRVRHSDSDFKRTERQREVVGLMMNKATALAKSGNLTRLNAVAVDVLSNIATSFTTNEILDLASRITDFHLGEQTGFPFRKHAQNGWMKDSVVPVNLANNVAQLHEFLYGTVNFVPSQNVHAITEEIRNQAGYDADWNLQGTAKPAPTAAPAPSTAPIETPAPTTASIKTPAPIETPSPIETPAPTAAPVETPAPTAAPIETPAPTAPLIEIPIEVEEIQ